MKRKIIAVMLTTLISFSLIACGKEKSVDETMLGQVATETETKIGDDSTEVIDIETEVPESTQKIETVSTEATSEEIAEILPLSYEDYNIHGYGHSNYIDLYGAGNGYEDVERISIMATNCDEYYNYPDMFSSDSMTYRGIKLGDSREDVIAVYGEPHSEPTYRNKAYNHDGLESQYNLCYDYIDENFPEVFFCLSFSMDQNDHVLTISYEAILMKWYE